MSFVEARRLSRRNLLALGLGAAGAVLATACGAPATPTAAPAAKPPAPPTSAPAAAPTQAPAAAPTTAPAATKPAAAAAATTAPATAATKPATSAAAPAATKPAAAASAGAVAPDLRIGFQPPYVAVFAMQKQQLLEKEFKGDKININWTRVVSPAPMYDALAGGSLDLGMGGTPIPQIAGGRPFRVIALIERSPKTHALLVKPDSPVKEVKELKGAKLATPLGKAYAFPLRALERAGLKDTDVEFLTIDNNEGRSALITGAIGAWATWDPFYASVESDKQARKLVDGDGFYPNYVTFFGRTEYLEKYPETVVRLLKNYDTAIKWVQANKAEALKIFSEEQKLKMEVAELTFARRNYVLEAPNDEYVKDVTDQGKLYLSLGVTKAEPDWKTAIDTTLIRKALG